MSLKMISYSEIASNDKIVMFEIQFEETFHYLFKTVKKVYFRRGYWERKDCLAFYSDDGSIMHGVYDSIKAVIKSNIKQYTF